MKQSIKVNKSIPTCNTKSSELPKLTQVSYKSSYFTIIVPVLK